MMNNIYEIRNVISKMAEEFSSIQSLRLEDLIKRIENECEIGDIY